MFALFTELESKFSSQMRNYATVYVNPTAPSAKRNSTSNGAFRFAYT